MNKRTENINWILGRGLVLCFFMFIFFALFTANSSHQDSPDKVVGFEQILESEHLAVLTDPIVSLTFNSNLIIRELNNYDLYDIDALKVTCSNYKVKHKLRLNKKRFQNIKSEIDNVIVFHIRSSVSTEEVPSIL